MLRTSRILGLALVLTALVGALVGPVEAVNTLKLQLEPGSHELNIDGNELVIETNRPLVVQLHARDGLIRGVLEAVGAAEATVRITLLGPPDVVIFDGQVQDPVDFDSSNADETGHAEL